MQTIKRFLKRWLLFSAFVGIIFGVMSFLAGNDFLPGAAITVLGAPLLAFPFALLDVLGASEMVVWAISRDKN